MINVITMLGDDILLIITKSNENIIVFWYNRRKDTLASLIEATDYLSITYLPEINASENGSKEKY